MTTQPKTLTREEADAFGRELEALRQEVVADLGQRGVDHIRRVITAARRSEAAGRLLLHFGIGPLTFVAGVSAVALAKILENMEIGHNVMHGQYDWMNDPTLDSATYEWDTVCDSDSWDAVPNHHTIRDPIAERDIAADTYSVSFGVGVGHALRHGCDVL